MSALREIIIAGISETIITSISENYNCEHFGILWLPAFGKIRIASVWENYSCQIFVYLSEFRKLNLPAFQKAITVSILEMKIASVLGNNVCPHFGKFIIAGIAEIIITSISESYNCQHLGTFQLPALGKIIIARISYICQIFLYLSAFRKAITVSILEVIIASIWGNNVCPHCGKL